MFATPKAFPGLIHARFTATLWLLGLVLSSGVTTWKVGLDNKASSIHALDIMEIVIMVRRGETLTEQDFPSKSVNHSS